MKICNVFLLFFSISPFIDAGFLDEKLPQELFNEIALYCQDELNQKLKTNFETFLNKREGGTCSTYICKKGNKKLKYKLNELRTEIIRECEGWEPVTIFKMSSNESIKYFALSPCLSKIIILKDESFKEEEDVSTIFKDETDSYLRFQRKDFYVVDRNNENAIQSITLNVPHADFVNGVAISDGIYFGIIKDENAHHYRPERNYCVQLFDLTTVQEIKKICFHNKTNFSFRHFSFDKNSLYIGVKYSKRIITPSKFSFSDLPPSQRYRDCVHIESLLAKKNQSAEWGKVLKNYIHSK